MEWEVYGIGKQVALYLYTKHDDLHAECTTWVKFQVYVRAQKDVLAR